MARKSTSNIRQALILAFGLGALTGAAGALTLHRRQAGDIPAGDAASQLGDTALPSPGGRFDEPSQGSVKTPAVQRG
ncbi:hypothetical protein [Micromonospora coerulea]|uniref:hypothetical protein n=1 Tax=Micromonospora coerulea TaxID=47856 RepID=UPI0019035E25|nr:hypothetical protein [Micromonospora veneta]